MSTVKKQIQDFTLNSTPDSAVQFVIQTSGGITQKTTKTALFNETDSALLGLQTQIDNLDLDYASTEQLVAVSGSLQTQVDNLDLVYATDADLLTVSGSLQTQIDNISVPSCVYGQEDCVVDQRVYERYKAKLDV